MIRNFCLFDSLDTLENDRVIVNAQTKCNVPQALAEGIIKSDTDPDQVAIAMKQSSDYMDKVWIHHESSGMSIQIHVESGDVTFQHERVLMLKLGRTYKNRYPVVELKEHEFSHQPYFIKKNFDNYQNMWAPDRPIIKHGVELYQQNFEISNRDKVRGRRLEYYNRGPINWKIACAKIITDHVKVLTISRKCEVHVEYRHDWRDCAGALINKTSDNDRDCLYQI